MYRERNCRAAIRAAHVNVVAVKAMCYAGLNADRERQVKDGAACLDTELIAKLWR